MPRYNASMRRVESLLEETQATLWIEHELAHFERQKHAPDYPVTIVNVAFESHVARPVDHAHAAAPEDRGDQVLLQTAGRSAGQRVGQLLYCISFCSA